MSSVERRTSTAFEVVGARAVGTLTRTLAATPCVSRAQSRIHALDLARGAAVALMILSHCVNGLLSFEDFPAWGLVPVHMTTKFASTLFILVFGIALAVVYLPHVHSAQWPQRRRKLLWRGLIVLFWYKVLTVVELAHLSEPRALLGAVLYVEFPSFVEILGFYAIALLWVPFFLPLWARMSLAARLASPIVLTAASALLYRYFDFWGIAQLQALLVEHENYYTWGQLARAPLILVGLLIGELVLRHYHHFEARRMLAVLLLGASSALWVLFFWLAAPNLAAEMMLIARNVGKHPPELLFMTFSTAGALLILSLALFGGERLAQHELLSPITSLGAHALNAFIIHIMVIFVFFRLLGFFHTVSYGVALTLALLLILATAFSIKVTTWVQAKT